MSSSYSRWSPSTGPGQAIGIMPPYPTFPALGIGIIPGIGYASNLGPNNTPDPGPPAADVAGLLLENSWNSFIELEDLSGILVQEP